MRVTVTGATGNIGTAVCRSLVEAGHEIVATDHVYRADFPASLKLADLMDELACYDLVRSSEALVHLGNHPGFQGRSPQETYARNLTMNANIMQAAVACGVRRLIFASSIQVICGRRSGHDNPPAPSSLPYLPLDGETPADPGNLYALSKLAGEQMLRYYVEQDHREGIAIRFSWTHHPWPAGHAPFFGLLDEAFAHMDTRDAGTLLAAILAADLPGYRVYLPAARKNMLGLPSTEIIEKYYPNVPLRHPIGPDDPLVDLSTLERETGWRPSFE